MNDLPSMHDEINEAFARRLQSGLPRLRGGAGYFCAPLQEFAGGALTPTDAPGQADTGSDIGGSEGGGVKV